MEQHRANPNCATCHARMDPLGFGFENFDAIGAWREKDGKFPIDASGVLPDGQTFKGPTELKAILKAKANEFARCLAEKMLTYALGRGLEVLRPVRRRSRSSTRWPRTTTGSRRLVLEIVKSDPFRKRRGKGGGS